MTTQSTTFDLSLPGPTLEAPLSFERHAQRMEGWLRERYPESGSYRVSLAKEKNPKRAEWKVRVDSGWFSGAEVALRCNKDSPHKAEVFVNWDSRFQRLLVTLGSLAAIPAGIVVFVVGLLMLKFLILVLFLLIVPLIFFWLMAVTMVAALVARGATLVFGNEFDADRRADLALRLKGLPIASALRS